MITPAHRAIIQAHVIIGLKRPYPNFMLISIINNWVVMGYDRDEVTALVDSVERQQQETTKNDHNTAT